MRVNLRKVTSLHKWSMTFPLDCSKRVGIHSHFPPIHKVTAKRSPQEFECFVWRSTSVMKKGWNLIDAEFYGV